MDFYKSKCERFIGGWKEKIEHLRQKQQKLQKKLNTIYYNIKVKPVFNDHTWDPKNSGGCRDVYVIKLLNGTSELRSLYTGGLYSEVVVDSGLPVDRY